MVQIYTTPNCSSCRKVKTYFSKHNINYTEKNIFSIPLTREDVFKMLSYREHGFEDIISTRSIMMMILVYFCQKSCEKLNVRIVLKMKNVSLLKL